MIFPCGLTDLNEAEIIHNYPIDEYETRCNHCEERTCPRVLKFHTDRGHSFATICLDCITEAASRSNMVRSLIVN